MKSKPISVRLDDVHLDHVVKMSVREKRKVSAMVAILVVEALESREEIERAVKP